MPQQNCGYDILDLLDSAAESTPHVSWSASKSSNVWYLSIWAMAASTCSKYDFHTSAQSGSTALRARLSFDGACKDFGHFERHFLALTSS